MSKKYGNSHYWCFIDDEKSFGSEITIWKCTSTASDNVELSGQIIARATDVYEARDIVDGLILKISQTTSTGLGKQEKLFLDFVKAHCKEPYATMAANALLWNDIESYKKLRDEFPMIYS